MDLLTTWKNIYQEEKKKNKRFTKKQASDRIAMPRQTLNYYDKLLREGH